MTHSLNYLGDSIAIVVNAATIPTTMKDASIREKFHTRIKMHGRTGRMKKQATVPKKFSCMPLYERSLLGSSSSLTHRGRVDQKKKKTK